MRIPVTNVVTIGEVAKKVRREQGIRQEDMASILGASHVFLRDVEHGKPTVQLGKVLRLLDELGITLILELPDEPEADSDRNGRP
ncbi:hypothetical protein GCM10007160_04630 [Litchfieldella qijiaojingensis]|uniref:HTH cro/C1-type domain-containing protein n=1 Tax=Litchfieldella qijiaojingensis TaxID=980347 RepID=A0ABQ2YDM5_9GAMM|nr:helix-turn-helix domain-containing protein [Halomonas qijiaojingensis]GGX80206.1 hypothetical protein GCM10007160_04630 [Halomonas qijiaojingensis]